MVLTETHGAATLTRTFQTIIDADDSLRYHGADIFFADPFAEIGTLQITLLKEDASSNVLRVVDSRHKAGRFFSESPVRCIGFPMIPSEKYRIRMRIINAGSAIQHPITWVHYEQEA